MKDAIIGYIKGYAGKHVLGIAVAVVVIIAGRSWLQEHDARLTADAAFQRSQEAVDTLKAERKAVEAQGRVALAPLQKQRAQVKTPAQAVEALRSSALDALQVQALPDSPGFVRVAALPLFQEQNQCAQDRVSLGVCQKSLDIQDKTDKEKDKQIADLKQKPRFWKRVGKAAKVIGCAGGGALAGGLAAGPKGAAIGGAGGAGICQLF